MTNPTDHTIAVSKELLKRVLDAFEDLEGQQELYRSTANTERYGKLFEELDTAIETGGWLPIEEAKRVHPVQFQPLPPPPKDHQ